MTGLPRVFSHLASSEIFTQCLWGKLCIILSSLSWRVAPMLETETVDCGKRAMVLNIHPKDVKSSTNAMSKSSIDNPFMPSCHPSESPRPLGTLISHIIHYERQSCSPQRPCQCRTSQCDICASVRELRYSSCLSPERFPPMPQSMVHAPVSSFHLRALSKGAIARET